MHYIKKEIFNDLAELQSQVLCIYNGEVRLLSNILTVESALPAEGPSPSFFSHIIKAVADEEESARLTRLIGSVSPDVVMVEVGAGGVVVDQPQVEFSPRLFFNAALQESLSEALMPSLVVAERRMEGILEANEMVYVVNLDSMTMWAISVGVQINESFDLAFKDQITPLALSPSGKLVKKEAPQSASVVTALHSLGAHDLQELIHVGMRNPAEFFAQIGASSQKRLLFCGVVGMDIKSAQPLPMTKIFCVPALQRYASSIPLDPSFTDGEVDFKREVSNTVLLTHRGQLIQFSDQQIEFVRQDLYQQTDGGIKMSAVIRMGLGEAELDECGFLRIGAFKQSQDKAFREWLINPNSAESLEALGPDFFADPKCTEAVIQTLRSIQPMLARINRFVEKEGGKVFAMQSLNDIPQVSGFYQGAEELLRADTGVANLGYLVCDNSRIVTMSAMTAVLSLSSIIRNSKGENIQYTLDVDGGTLEKRDGPADTVDTVRPIRDWLNELEGDDIRSIAHGCIDFASGGIDCDRLLARLHQHEQGRHIIAWAVNTASHDMIEPRFAVISSAEFQPLRATRVITDSSPVLSSQDWSNIPEIRTRPGDSVLSAVINSRGKKTRAKLASGQGGRLLHLNQLLARLSAVNSIGPETSQVKFTLYRAGGGGTQTPEVSTHVDLHRSANPSQAHLLEVEALPAAHNVQRVQHSEAAHASSGGPAPVGMPKQIIVLTLEGEEVRVTQAQTAGNQGLVRCAYQAARREMVGTEVSASRLTDALSQAFLNQPACIDPDVVRSLHPLNEMVYVVDITRDEPTVYAVNSGRYTELSWPVEASRPKNYQAGETWAVGISDSGAQLSSVKPEAANSRVFDHLSAMRGQGVQAWLQRGMSEDGALLGAVEELAGEKVVSAAIVCSEVSQDNDLVSFGLSGLLTSYLSGKVDPTLYVPKEDDLRRGDTRKVALIDEDGQVFRINDEQGAHYSRNKECGFDAFLRMCFGEHHLDEKARMLGGALQDRGVKQAVRSWLVSDEWSKPVSAAGICGLSHGLSEDDRKVLQHNLTSIMPVLSGMVPMLHAVSEGVCGVNGTVGPQAIGAGAAASCLGYLGDDSRLMAAGHWIGGLGYLFHYTGSSLEITAMTPILVMQEAQGPLARLERSGGDVPLLGRVDGKLKAVSSEEYLGKLEKFKSACTQAGIGLIEDIARQYVTQGRINVERLFEGLTEMPPLGCAVTTIRGAQHECSTERHFPGIKFQPVHVDERGLDKLKPMTRQEFIEHLRSSIGFEEDKLEQPGRVMVLVANEKPLFCKHDVPYSALLKPVILDDLIWSSLDASVCQLVVYEKQDDLLKAVSIKAVSFVRPAPGLSQWVESSVESARQIFTYVSGAAYTTFSGVFHGGVARFLDSVPSSEGGGAAPPARPSAGEEEAAPAPIEVEGVAPPAPPVGEGAPSPEPSEGEGSTINTGNSGGA